VATGAFTRPASAKRGSKEHKCRQSRGKI